MRVLVFGDSITQGFWAVEAGWVERIRQHYDTIQVGDLRHKDEPTIFNLGISANNSGDVLKRIKAETLARIGHNHSITVLVQIGTNDSSVCRDTVDVSIKLAEYRHNLEEIVEQLQPIAQKIVLVGVAACDESKTVPVFWNGIDYTDKQLKSYEDVMKSVADQTGTYFIPVFEAFKQELEKGADLLADGLHPNDNGHKIIADIVLHELEKLI